MRTSAIARGRLGLESLERWQKKRALASAALAGSNPSSPSSSSYPPVIVGPSDPFKAWKKNPSDRYYRRPAFSLREQAMIVKDAFRQGRLDEVPDCPKKTKLLRRLQMTVAAPSIEEAILRPNTVPSTAESSKKKESPQAIPDYTDKEIEGHQEAIIAYLASRKGPYMGRGLVKRYVQEQADLAAQRASESTEGSTKAAETEAEREEREMRAAMSAFETAKTDQSGLRKFFKGTKWEREQPQRKQDIKSKMEEMPKDVAAYRKERQEAARAKVKSVPF